MFRKLSGRTSPLLKPPNSGLKSKSQPLTICSAALPNLTAVKTVPEARTTQGELLPPEIVLSILNGFAMSLLADQHRFELLKSKCLDGTKLGHDHDLSATATGSILKSSHTVLTYLTWGIRHLEKASASLQQGDKESIGDHLKNAEQMLKSLIESMQLELDDCPTIMLSSARVPNAGFIVGLAHVFLALVCRLMKNTSNHVAFHLLEAFVVSPNNARKSFIPELWSQLFGPHLSAVDAWYKKEYTNIVSSFSRPPSISADSKPCSPKTVDKSASPTAMHVVVTRANSLMDLVTGMGLSKRGTNAQGNERKPLQNEHDQAKLLEKMNMQLKLLSNLYEQSLDEGTIQYARHYQDLVASYYGRFSCDQGLRMHKALQNTINDGQLQHTATACQKDKKEVTTTVEEAAVPKICTNIDDDDDAVDDKLMSGGGWIAVNGLQFRRNLFEAIFGAVHIHKTNKKDRNYNTSPSYQISSLLHLCSKELPRVIDPLRPKVEMEACTRAGSNEPSVGNTCAAGKPTTIRDVVNTAFSPLPQELATLNTCTPVRTAVKSHSLSAETFVENDLLTPDPTISDSMTSDLSTELSPAYYEANYQDITFKQDCGVMGGAYSKRLIDFIQVKHHQSDTKSSSTRTPGLEGDQLSGSCQTNISTSAVSMEGTEVEEQRIITRSNLDNPKKNHASGRTSPTEQGLNKMTSTVQSSRRDNGQTTATAAKKLDIGKPKMDDNQTTEEVQVKYCTSLQVQRTRSLNTHTFESQLNEHTGRGNASHTFPSEVEAQKDLGEIAGKPIFNQLEEVASKLQAVVLAAQSSNNAPEDVGRCEEVLLQLSQSWLECKTAMLLQQKGDANKKVNSVTGNDDAHNILCDLTNELLYILANSELQEAQRLALCLLSASIGTRKSSPNDSAPLPQHNLHAKKGGECSESDKNQLPSDPNVLHALSHLLQQQDRLPEAAILLHLLHPTQYSTSCHQFLPHLLPLLLDLAQRNTMPTAEKALDHIASSCNSPFHGHHNLIWESLKPRALALLMMSQLLAAVDKATRLQACKHVLFPNVNGLPCFLHSLDCAPNIDEKIAAAFILTTCMQADDISRQHIVKHVKLPSVVAMLQQSASNGSAFRTAVNFVTELLCARKASIAELLSCIRQDGLLNCMHALMAYLQTASLENQPPAAGLLLQLDLFLGGEQYSVFREEALEALLLPLLKEGDNKATIDAAHILSTIGCSHSEQELEAWLLKKAGLAATVQEERLNRRNKCWMNPTRDGAAPASKAQEQEEEEEGTMIAEWDARVACALIGHGEGRLVSNALAKGLQSRMAEVRKACLLVAAWLTFHLASMHASDLHHPGHRRRYTFSRGQSKVSAKDRMREALQPKLQEMAAAGSGCAIVERVFAAFALRNLTK